MKKKKIHVDGFVFLSLHIYRRHLSAQVWKMIPNLLLIGKNIITFSNKCFKVDQHPVLNELNHDKSAVIIHLHLRSLKMMKKIYVDRFVFCHCTSTEGTYHHQFK